MAEYLENQDSLVSLGPWDQEGHKGHQAVQQWLRDLLGLQEILGHQDR